MTKKLEETFNLPDIGDIAPEDQLDEVHDPSGEIAPPPDLIQTKEALSLAEKIDNALPEVKDINTSDGDMDRYADKAEKAFEDLMDLGFNVDPTLKANSGAATAILFAPKSSVELG